MTTLLTPTGINQPNQVPHITLRHRGPPSKDSPPTSSWLNPEHSIVVHLGVKGTATSGDSLTWNGLVGVAGCSGNLVWSSFQSKPINRNQPTQPFNPPLSFFFNLFPSLNTKSSPSTLTPHHTPCPQTGCRVKTPHGLNLRASGVPGSVNSPGFTEVLRGGKSGDFL